MKCQTPPLYWCGLCGPTVLCPECGNNACNACFGPGGCNRCGEYEILALKEFRDKNGREPAREDFPDAERNEKAQEEFWSSLDANTL